MFRAEEIHLFPFVPAKAGTQGHMKEELDSRFRGNEWGGEAAE
jgi:hypothetical protein